ncbi:lytic transglycosylase domain-containing protein [Neorhizobium sp. NCHU2750]|uniref:transglycosylase SLT domain-containing protein n=1 Tax=Neorhizobium sp. NCHU2750 TaxID=1825976 RepID=UPI001FE2352D
MVIAMSSALAACSSVEHDNAVASKDGKDQSVQQPADAQQIAAANAAAASQTEVTLVKTSRLPVPVPTVAEATTVQSAAMASPTMAPFVAMQQISPASVGTQPLPAASSTALAASTTLAATTEPASHSLAKGSRLVSPVVAPAVQSGQIQPAAAEAIALDEPELTPDMVALQSVIPIPRPMPRPTLGPQGASTALGYAGQPKPLAAVAAIDSRMEFPPAPGEPMPASAAGAPADLQKLIHRYAGLYGVPESLVHRVVHRESKYDPSAYHKNGYWGLMQIKYSTAKSMGYQGPPEGLLDPETNLKYAIKYLRGAWLVADNQNDDAIRLYARGYYYDAKRKDMLSVLQK